MPKKKFTTFVKDLKCIEAVKIKQLDYKHLLTSYKNIKLNQIKFMKIFLKHYNINEIDKNGESLLHVACRNCDVKLVKYLLLHKINVNLKDKNGNTSLNNIIISKSRSNIIHLLLKTKSININNINNERKTAFHLATENGNNNYIQLLIKYCHTKIIKLNDKLYLETVYTEPEKTVKLILPYVNINATVKHGYDISRSCKDGESALHMAIKLGRINMIELLLENNIDVNITDVEGNTPLLLALSKFSTKNIITILLEYGADCNISNDNNSTLYFALVYDDVSVIALMLPKIDNINYFKYEPVLHTAIRRRSEAIIELILQYNVDVNLTSIKGKFTALQLALYHRLSKKIILSLIEHGADCQLSSEYNSTLQYAVRYDDMEIIKLIISKIDTRPVRDCLMEIYYYSETIVEFQRI